MAWCQVSTCEDLDSVDDPPAANKLPMVTNSLGSNSLNEKSLQLSVLQDATELTPALPLWHKSRPQLHRFGRCTLSQMHTINA